MNPLAVSLFRLTKYLLVLVPTPSPLGSGPGSSTGLDFQLQFSPTVSSLTFTTHSPYDVLLPFSLPTPWSHEVNSQKSSVLVLSWLRGPDKALLIGLRSILIFQTFSFFPFSQNVPGGGQKPAVPSNAQTCALPPPPPPNWPKKPFLFFGLTLPSPFLLFPDGIFSFFFSFFFLSLVRVSSEPPRLLNLLP